MNAHGFAGAFLFEADGRACSIRMRKTKMGGAIAPGIHLIEAPHPADRRSEAKAIPPSPLIT
jgi:hypothetical protein